MTEILRRLNKWTFRQVSPCFATRRLLVFAGELWWIDQVSLELRWGAQ
jgi:hypothetical protein